MTATDPTKAALIRAILLHPAEETPRLMYADYLDETAGDEPCRACAGFATTHGVRKVRDKVYHQTQSVCPTCGGTGRRSDGRRERAEFIRVQIGLAAVERDRVTILDSDTDWARCTGVSAVWCPNCGDCRCPDREDRMDDPGCPLHAPDSPHDCHAMLAVRRSPLAARERALWREWYRQWFGAGVGTDNFGSCLTPNEVDPRVRRGFVAEVRMPLAAFLTAAPGLFAGHPIESVILTDREPEGFRNDGFFRWFMAGEVAAPVAADPSILPDDLWRLFHDHQPYSASTLRHTLGWEFENRVAALAALNPACVAYGRRLAGLPVETPI